MSAIRKCVIAFAILKLVQAQVELELDSICEMGSDCNQDGLALSLVQRSAKRVSKSKLQLALAKVVGNAPARQLFAVEESIRQTFETFPKNSQGKIPGQDIFSSIVRDYFATEHGWVIQGMEAPMMRPKITESFEALILQEKAPDLAAALSEIQVSQQGVSLSDVVGTVSAIEYLILEESKAILKAAYELNVHPGLDQVNSTTLHEVLRSYLMLFREGSSSSNANAAKHAKQKAAAQEDEQGWDSLVGFEHGVVTSSGQSEPFKFQVMEQLVNDLAIGYGRWQNSECLDMKTFLMGLDAEGIGSVPLSLFQTAPNHTAFQFTETAEYLRRVGALDESMIDTMVEPRVRIANYLLTPSNCIASSKYYSVCCLSECEGLIDIIESKVKQPTMSPDELLDILSTVPSSTVSVPREIPEELAQELRVASTHHQGVVPLHSSDFKIWLHSAFPNECPYPTVTENLAEDSEEASAHAWELQELQKQQCTRIPKWQTVGDGIMV